MSDGINVVTGGGASSALTAQKAILPSIQWLRAIAAMMVIVHHAIYYSNSLREQFGQAPFEFWGFSSWWFGIHIFFVVSGFIMIHTTPNFGEPGAWRQFLARRIIRVAPLYWILTTVMVAIVVVAPRSMEIAADKLQYILFSYLFVPALRAPGDLRPILGQGWTLDYEMFFYAAFAFATLLPRRRAIVALTVGFVALAWLGRELDTSTPILFTWTDGLILEFLFGVYLGLAFEGGRRLPGWAAAAAIAAGVALVVANLQGPTFLTSGAPAALIVGGFVLGPRMTDSPATAWLTRLGDASYSLYLTHTFVVRPLRNLWAVAVGDALPTSLFLIAATLASVVVGAMVYRLLERPMTKFLQKKLVASVAPTPRSAGRQAEASSLR